MGSDKLLNLNAMRQLTELCKGRNSLFGNHTVFALAKDTSPVLWWKSWGSGFCPELTTVAMRVLAQPCTASESSAGRVWSAYGRVHTDARNRLTKDRAKKLVKVYFNGRALEKARKVEWESQAFLWDETSC